MAGPESIRKTSEGKKTALLTVTVIVSNVLGNVMLSHGMKQVGPIVSASPVAYLHAFVNPWTFLGVVVLTSWMVLDLALLSRADLTYVLPMTASAYVLIAVAGHFWFHEPATWVRWVAITTICVGVALAGETPPKTTPNEPPEVL